MTPHKFLTLLVLMLFTHAAQALGSDTPQLIKMTAEIVKLVRLGTQQLSEVQKTKAFIEDVKNIENIRDLPLEYVHNEDARFLIKDMKQIENEYENPLLYPDDRVYEVRKILKDKWKDSTYRKADIYRERSDRLYGRMDNLKQFEKGSNNNYESAQKNNTARDSSNLTAASTAFLANAAVQKQKEEEQQKLFNLHQRGEMDKSLKDAEKLYGAMGAIGAVDKEAAY